MRAFGWGLREQNAKDIIRGRGVETERTLVALDAHAGGAVVGTTSAYSLRMTMPGGALVPVAGVDGDSCADSSPARRDVPDDAAPAR